MYHCHPDIDDAGHHHHDHINQVRRMMRAYSVTILTLAVLLHGSAIAGGSKTPPAVGTARHFSAKNALQRIPSAAERTRLEADMNTLAARYQEMSAHGALSIQWEEAQGIPGFGLEGFRRPRCCT